MPMIDVYHTEGAFTDEAKAALVEGLSALLLDMEGAPDNDMSRSLSWVFLHEMPAGSVFIAGRPAADHRYKLIFSVPEGTPKLHGPMARPRRAEMYEAATQLVLAAEGVPDTLQNRYRIWCFLHEVPDGTWGASGYVVHIQDIQAIVAVPGVEDTPLAGLARLTVEGWETA